MTNFIVCIRSNKQQAKKLLFLISSYLLSAGIAFIVYATGGTNKVYTNLMYIPICIVAVTNGYSNAVVHAFISAMIIGPFMPLDVQLGKMQEPINWALRALIYFIIAMLVGLLTEYDKKEYKKRIHRERQLIEAQQALIFSMVKLSERRDDETGIHVDRVAALCRHLAGILGSLPEYTDYITDDYIENIFLASPLHDIGKVGIPDSILLKPGKLSPEEFEIMKTHTTIGAATLTEVQGRYNGNRLLNLAISIAHHHHERWDGTGYPAGLSGKDIPLSARIMAIVDVYDALRSKRVYKEPYSHEKSIEIIKEGENTFFDPAIVSAFVGKHFEFMGIYDELSIEKST